MTCYEKLVSFHILSSQNDTKLITWSYPSLSETHKTFLLSKCFKLKQLNSFLYLRNDFWMYIQENTLSSSQQFSVVLIAKDFSPDKYKTMCGVFSKLYLKTQNRVELVRLYLDIFITSSCNLQENGNIVTHSFKNVKSKTAVKEFIQKFDINFVLIYVAILLKKRVLICHSEIQHLQEALLTITNLVTVRNPNDYLFPYVQNAVEELKVRSFFVAGITNSKYTMQTDLYDLFVNLVESKAIISPHAKSFLSMNKMYKDIAMPVLQALPNMKDEDIVLHFSRKTSELLAQLKGLASQKTSSGNMITMEVLKDKNFSPTVESFLFNFAIAENLMLL